MSSAVADGRSGWLRSARTGAAEAAHFANTTASALLAWAGLPLVVVRIGRTGDCRWWLAGGVVADFGVADDHSMSFFASALVIGTQLCPGVTGVAPVGRTHSVSDMQDGSQFTDEEEQGWLAKAALEELAAEKRLADSPVTSQLDGPLDLRHQIIRAEAHRDLDL